MSLVFVSVMLLCLCACDSKYVCAECGEDYEHEPSKYSTDDLCRDCFNQQPYSHKYCACGNSADDLRSTKYGSYLCSNCWNSVENAVQNALS